MHCTMDSLGDLIEASYIYIYIYTLFLRKSFKHKLCIISLQLFKLFDELLDEVKLISKKFFWVCKHYKGWGWCEKEKKEKEKHKQGIGKELQ
jgi:hypothetical protein